MNINPSVLVVDDEENARAGLKTLLQIHGYEVDEAKNGFQALDKVKMDQPDIVLTDLRMPEMDGIELIKKIQVLSPQTMMIMMTAYGTVESAVEAIKLGAFDYLTKPINTDELIEILKKAVSRKKLELENLELKDRLREHVGENEFIYKSNKIAELVDIVKQVAPSSATVLIEGDSGTGKELIAQMLHKHSDRALRPFIPVHCASLTDSLLASELFGHERGAFTDAVQKKIGRFERANMGTIFLDEIGEIPETMQVKLLRVLQESEFERVGGTKPIKVDVRIICATNKNLSEEVKQGLFREDLYYRINVVTIRIPPLSERKDDIEPLVQYFLKEYSKKNRKKIIGVSKEALEVLKDYRWPGNVRELKNVIERLVVLSRGPIIEYNHIPADIRNEGGEINSVTSSNESGKLSDLEKDAIVRALKECDGNKSKVAKNLGISRRTLYRKLASYCIE